MIGNAQKSLNVIGCIGDDLSMLRKAAQTVRDSSRAARSHIPHIQNCRANAIFDCVTHIRLLNSFVLRILVHFRPNWRLALTPTSVERSDRKEKGHHAATQSLHTR